MKLLLNIILLVAFATSGYAKTDEHVKIFTPSKNDILAVEYTVDGKIEKEFNDFTKNDLKKIGFFLNDPHHRVNDLYEKTYGYTALDVIAFSSIVDEANIRPLFNIDPRLAGFSPFNLLIYKRLNENQTHIAHLTPEAILDILEIDDPVVRKKVIDSFPPLDKAIEAKFHGKKSFIKLHGYAKDAMMNFEIPFEEPDDIDDFLEDFQEKFESAFVEKKYIIAGFYNFKESFNSDEDDLPGFVSFWSYALCHLTFSYNVFDTDKGRPEAGIFAPCSMYVYVKEGENKIVIGMPRLHDWSAALGFTDPKKMELVNQLDTEIPEIIKSLGGIEVPNGNPLKRSALKDNGVKEKISKKTEKNEILISDTKNKSLHTVKPREVKEASTAGYMSLPAYLIGKYAKVEQVYSDLKHAGFEILATTPLDKKHDLTVITYTSKTLKDMATKKNRGFIAVMKVLVDNINHQISIMNPLYFAKAYMQNDFDEKQAIKVLDKLNHTFGSLHDSKDHMTPDKLASFRYLKSLPDYNDMEIVGRGEDNVLLQKAKKSGKVLFSLALENKSYVLGIKLSRKTSRFPKKIGLQNAEILPYLILIENNKAKILKPEYNVPLFYPQMSIDDFMRISLVPGAIHKESEKIFK